MRTVRARNRAKFAPMLGGRGLEIGAGGSPFPFAPGVHVRHADILAEAATTPDIVSEGESLPSIADGELDFVVANHVLEHVTDPIGALTEWHRIVREGGLLLIALPDKRYMFDRPRKRTTLEHLIADHASQAATRDRNRVHFEEWATHIENLPPRSPEWQAWVTHAYECGGMVHNHVWVAADILRLLKHLDLWSVAAFRNTSPLSNEFILLLRKSSDRRSIDRALVRAVAAEPFHIAISAIKASLQKLLR